MTQRKNPTMTDEVNNNRHQHNNETTHSPKSTISAGGPLPDFRSILVETKQAAANFDFSADYQLTEEYRTNFIAVNEKWDIQSLNEYSIVTKVHRSNRVEGTTSTMLLYAALAIPFLKCLSIYISIMNQKNTTFSSIINNPNMDRISKLEKLHPIITDYYPDNLSSFIDLATERMLDFAENPNAWGRGKDINRPDALMSPFCTALNLVQQSSTYLFDIANLYLKNTALYQAACNALATASSLPAYMGGTGKRKTPQTLQGNILVYGAPGTGKSYDIETQARSDGKIVQRTVFHSEYSYFDFVGTYKPVPLYRQHDNSTYMDAGGNSVPTTTPVIDYQYVPGPFLELLVEALKHPEREYCLIIEELNRANAAAVFGDMFQLLDRGEDNASEYGITPQPDVANYLMSQGLSSAAHSLHIPSNYTIAATMNNADQGVTYLDAAFKRRWITKYKPIDLSRNPALSRTLIHYAGLDYKLVDILRLINARLSDVYSRPEDRLIGPFNITEQALKADQLRRQGLVADDHRNEPFEKVLMYLYDDALRSFRRDENAFADSVKNLNDLLTLYPTKNVLNLDLSEIVPYETYPETSDNSKVFTSETIISNIDGDSRR